MTAQTPLDPNPRPRTAARVISIATIALGAAVIAGTLGSTAVSATAQMSRVSDNQAVTVAGVSRLEADVAGGGLVIAFDDVARAELDVDRAGDAPGWTLDQRGDTLRVSSPEGGWFRGDRGGSSATLTLPRELEDGVLDAAFDVSGGTLNLVGTYRALAIDLAGGRVTVDATAPSVELTVAGGTARADLVGVDDASFELAGGELTAALRGDAPGETDIEVTAGSADITLPDDVYRVSVDDGTGRVDNRLLTTTDAGAPSVDVTATFGAVLLRPAT